MHRKGNPNDSEVHKEVVNFTSCQRNANENSEMRFYTQEIGKNHQDRYCQALAAYGAGEALRSCCWE